MRPVYQRLPALAVAASLPWSLAACGGQAERAPAPAAPAAELPLASLLAARSYEMPQAVYLSAAQIATELSPAGTRVVVLPQRAGERLRSLTPAALDCRALANEPDGDRALVECAEPASGATSLALYDTRSAVRVATLGAESGERFLTWSTGDGTLWTAAAAELGRPARLFATTRTLARRPVTAAPPGFEIVAVAPEAGLALFRRELDGEVHEVVLHDWRRDESRLLLPTGADGRFTEAHFVGGEALLMFADDGGDAPRLERLELASGERVRWGRALDCPPLAMRAHAGGSTTVVVDCDGRRHALRLDAAGGGIALPATASGIRIVDWAPAFANGALLLATAGERWPVELARSDADGDFRPLTYALSGRIAPAALPTPRPWRWTSAGVELPAELWPAATAQTAAVAVWFEAAERPPEFGIHRPLAAALAAGGMTTLVVRGRGDELLSRRLRRAADGDPFAAAWTDLRAAAAVSATLAPASAPRVLIGGGRWWGAAALALATRDDAPYAAVFALFPDLDPLAPAAAAAGEAAPDWQRARWGERTPAELAALARDWSFPVERVRRPTWLALDPRQDPAGASAARLAAAAIGVPVVATRAVPRPWHARLPGELERELAARLLEVARNAAR
jgi:hypothetical protein